MDVPWQRVGSWVGTVERPEVVPLSRHTAARPHAKVIVPTAGPAEPHDGHCAATVSRESVWLLGFTAAAAAASRRCRSRLCRRASVSTFRKREEKRERRRRWLQGLEKVDAEAAEAEGTSVPSGKAPVFASAAEESSSTKLRRGLRSEMEEPLDWNNPGTNVLEKARLAAEDWGGWDEAGWSADPAASAGSVEAIPLPGFFRMRRAQAEPPKAIKEFIALHQLGNVKLPKLKRGEHRPAIFAGFDPAHDGRRGAVDDGRGDTLGRMAAAVHKGFLRQRARCHPSSSPPLAERPEVAFIGASNVGKSSLLNSLTRTQQLAPAKDDPGVTRSIDWYKCSRLPLDVIDLPGYGYAKGAEFGPLVAQFLQSRKSLRVLYCLVDARTGIRPTDWRFYASLGNRGPEKVFILTKCDMVVPKMLAKVATLVLEDIRSIPRSSQRLIMVSARQGQGLHDLRCHLCSRAVTLMRELRRRQREHSELSEQ
ncbi:engB [Symbiodinium necroappetens]|uniref:EngB protein n=1 Tax=Symbiodinium necroappetens TaxID=1628268 RepID=A0A812VT17_9DINO|nr:engB [Symbiodinium necroappetens]